MQEGLTSSRLLSQTPHPALRGPNLLVPGATLPHPHLILPGDSKPPGTSKSHTESYFPPPLFFSFFTQKAGEGSGLGLELAGAGAPDGPERLQTAALSFPSPFQVVVVVSLPLQCIHLLSLCLHLVVPPFTCVRVYPLASSLLI